MEGNQVKQVPVASGQWAEEFEQHDASEAGPRTWGDEFGSLHENDLDKYFDSKTNGRDWAEEFANQMSSGGVWAEEFGEGKFANESIIENWEEEYLAELEKIHNPVSGISSNGAYQMSQNNPFLTEVDSFSKGRELFRQGLLSEAVLAIEAECQRNPGNVEAWRLLGTVQAENDDDTQAIAALNQALACDPDNLEVLFSLGVSYTNELAEKQALEHLKAWLIKHPNHGKLASYDQGPPDSSQSMSYTIQMFQQAAAAAPDDADVHAALGVLCNLGRRYSDAVASFRKALSLKSNDYSLWNKLGATLANSAQSGEALDAYRRALEAKPNYMRAWANMGISLANLGEYEDSSRYYIRALALNSNAGAVWGYLRTSLLCAGRDDLLELVEKEDLSALQQILPL
jgi:peroxin-5